MNRPAAKLIRLRWQKHSHQHIGLHLNADGARLLFQVFVDACERQSIVITTNLEFSRWGSVFGGDQMATAAIDRIVHHGRLIQFRGVSYRVRHVLMQEG